MSTCSSGETRNVELAGVFVRIGLIPNNEWLKCSELALTRFVEIEIDARGETSMLGVFAAGDATTVPYKQIVISMGAGATAALSAFDHLIRTDIAEPVSEKEKALEPA
jgi:alkyl hydroperoxide reductase subunit F